ncbi:MAG: hypothetical protein U1D30_21965 [Planctomycetota bacterium]
MSDVGAIGFEEDVLEIPDIFTDVLLDAANGESLREPLASAS